jgi:putative Holliday junction resolvase
MNVLALDFGLKRIGVAVGSTLSGIAFPRDVLMNDSNVFVNLSRILSDERIETILVGSPLKRDGAAGDIDVQLQQFLASLREMRIPVEIVDERYTSKMAQEKLHRIGVKVKDQKDVSDSIAAQVLLQDWLDARS